MVVIALCVMAASFAMTPYGQKSQVIWDEFRHQEGLDAVCLGSSLAARAYNPMIVDELCGSSSFNMSTPAQQPAESYIGLREAISTFDIDRVYYGIDYSSFVRETDLYPGRAFENEKWKGDEPFEWVSDLDYMLEGSDWLFTEKSINWLFPWTESQAADGLSGFFRNAMMRIDGTTLIEAAEINERGWYYYGRGYGNYTTVFDYNGSTQTDFADMEGLGYTPVYDSQLRHLANMADLCAEHDIEFIAFVPALPDFSLISMGYRYNEISGIIRDTVERHGGTVYDFNLAKTAFYHAEENDFEDYAHYNANGGKRFSEAFAQVLLSSESNDDPSSWFETYEERIESIDHISRIRIQEHPIEHGSRIKVCCYSGPNVKPEYQILAKGDDDAEFQIVRDWSPQSEFDFTPSDQGLYTIRVNARSQGSSEEFERWCESTVQI